MDFIKLSSDISVIPPQFTNLAHVTQHIEPTRLRGEKTEFKIQNSKFKSES